MLAPENRHPLRESLERLMDALCDPNLTIDRARTLRPQLTDILNRLEREQRCAGNEVADATERREGCADSAGDPAARGTSPAFARLASRGQRSWLGRSATEPLPA